MREHSLPVRMAVIKTNKAKTAPKVPENTKYWHGYGEMGPLHLAGRNVRWYSFCGK